MRYRLSALAELEEIWSYLAEDASVTMADRPLDAVFERFELLAEQPRTDRVRPEFGEGGVILSRLAGQRANPAIGLHEPHRFTRVVQTGFDLRTHRDPFDR